MPAVRGRTIAEIGSFLSPISLSARTVPRGVIYLDASYGMFIPLVAYYQPVISLDASYILVVSREASSE